MDTISSLFPNLHWSNLLFLPGLLVGFTVHELGHSITAYFLGDTSQIKKGAISANPSKHISWMGTIFFIFFGVGWPKLLQFDPEHFKDRYLDTFLVSIAGAAANLAASVVIFAMSVSLLGLLRLFNLLDGDQFATIMFFNRTSELAALDFPQALQNASVWIIAFTNRIWVANFILALISLIPLPPFDGFTAVMSLLGVTKERRLSQLAEPAVMRETKMVEPPKIVSKKQSMADIHFKLGTDYHRQQQFTDAIARYRQAIMADSTFGPAYVNMGLAYKAKDQRSEAIQAFRGATRYAHDEKSKNQAWGELHNLSALPDISPPEQESKSNSTGSTPWTDTKPSPDWIAFWAGAIALVFTFSCIVGILLTNLFRQ